MILRLVSVLLLMLSASPAFSALNIFTCEPEWAALAEEIGGDRVTIYSATTAFQDPHHIEARPSLIAQVRRADLLICSGAELEAGWLPLLIRQAGNASVLPNNIGYFEAASFVERLDVTTDIDRSKGDVHASGNPHVHLDPRRLLTISYALTERLIKIDPDNANFYQQRLEEFSQRWQSKMEEWLQMAKPLKGQRIVVHHRDWVYLFDWLGIEIAGALEPKPGLPASAGHLVALKQSMNSKPALMIVYTAYQNPRAAKRLSDLTAIPAVELPYTVGGSDRANDLFGLFEDTIKKMTGALQ